jgi:AraC-like DNA-binding protein
MVKIKSGFLGERAIVLPAPIVEEFKTDSLGKLLSISDIGFYPNAAYHFRSRTASEAEQNILIYCLDGEGWFETRGIKYKVQANHFFILPKGKAHAYGSTKDKTWTIYWIHFDGTHADFFANDFDKPVHIPPEKDSRIEERIRLFEEIFSTLKNGYSKSNLQYTVTVLFHFLGSVKFLGTYRAATTNVLQTANTTDDAIHFMRENISRQLTLNDLSAFAGLSPSHFSSVFREKTGYSPLSYFSHLKIQEACHLLDFTTYKVNQISQMTGYSDPLYFTRIFTKTMGISPREYRSLKKG